MKNLVLVSLFAATLAACGGGGSSAPPAAAAPTPAIDSTTPAGPAPAPAPAPATALQLAQTFLAGYDASNATAVPTTGAANNAFNDGCFLGDGYTKPLAIATFDVDAVQSAQSNKYRIGTTRTNVQILADRVTTNTDGSGRRELDIQYVVNYADGTVDTVNKQTLITGSSFGSAMVGTAKCTTPDNNTNLRFYGNRSIVDADVRAYNTRNQRNSLATGAALAVPVDYSKYIQFRIADPANVAKYVVITGPGLPASGVKMVSPIVQRDDPLFAGKRGNFVDWKSTDTFRYCRSDATTGTVAGNTADCVTYGAAGNNYGVFNTTAALVDSGFSTSWVAGGVYTIAVYNDLGWTTVNGQATQTPIATYSRTLGALPYSAVALAGTGVTTDLYPRVTSSLTSAQVAAVINSKASSTTNLSWNALGVLPDASKFGWGDIYAFVSGRATATLATYPASRQVVASYPASGATSATAYVIPAAPSVLVTPTYGEFAIELSNRNGNRITSLVTFE
jgi:hypothetical protein